MGFLPKVRPETWASGTYARSLLGRIEQSPTSKLGNGPLSEPVVEVSTEVGHTLGQLLAQVWNPSEAPGKAPGGVSHYQETWCQRLASAQIAGE